MVTARSRIIGSARYQVVTGYIAAKELCLVVVEILVVERGITAAFEEGRDFDGVTGLKNVFREDTVVPSFPQEEILANVDGGENGYFPVKKRM